MTEVLIATADSRQKIYKVENSAAELTNSVSHEYVLKYHFRNGFEICRLADGIARDDTGYKPMLPHSNYDEKVNPCKVKPFPNLTLEGQAAEMATHLKSQLLGYPEQLLAVLCPKNSDLDEIGIGLVKAGLGPYVTRANEKEDFDPSKPIWLSTIAAAKGLEFRAVHIGGLESLSRMGDAQKRLIYTGATRAKTSLNLYWNNSIPGYLDAAIRAVVPKTTAVTKQNIFGQA